MCIFWGCQNFDMWRIQHPTQFEYVINTNLVMQKNVVYRASLCQHGRQTWHAIQQIQKTCQMNGWISRQTDRKIDGECG